MKSKRISFSVIAAMQPAIIGILAGMEFELGFNLAFVYGFGLVLGLFVYYAPMWK